jgi:phosphatidylglycerophosphatase A
MAIKESSDKLNAGDFIALSIATWGVGYLPLMPGTFGSLVGVGIFWLLTRTASGNGLIVAALIAIVAVTFAGIWAASRTEALAGRKDPGKVVVDEVAGQLISLFPLTLVAQWSTSAVIVSFILFRLFDIFKPYPASRLEALKGGFGIMCDDLGAGVYGAIVTAIFLAVI